MGTTGNGSSAIKLWGYIYKIVRRSVPKWMDLESITGDIWLKEWLRDPDGPKVNRVIIRYLAINAWKKEMGRGAKPRPRALSFSQSDAVGLLAEMASSTEDEGIKTYERQDEIERLIECLSIRERVIVVLKYYRGHTNSEIARFLGLSPLTIPVYHTRILQKLRKESEDGQAKAQAR